MKKYFMESYIEECFEYEIIWDSTKTTRKIEAKYKNEYLNKVLYKQCQHIIESKQKDLLSLLKIWSSAMEH